MLQSTEPQRLRQVEIERRIYPILLVVAGSMWLGLWSLALAYDVRDVLVTSALGVVYTAVMFVAQHRAERSSAPLAWLSIQEFGILGLLAYTISWSGGVHSPALPMTILVALLIGIRFPWRWSAVQVAITGPAILAGVVIGDPAAFRDAPLEAISWLMTFVIAVLIATMLARAERGARRDAIHDALTGSLNRKALQMRVETARGGQSRRAETLSVIAADLDGLKGVNDRFGHEAGDAVLRGVAAALRRSIREGDLLYRLGGDEFIILLPATPTSEAAELAERLRATIRSLRPAGHEVTLSAGVAGVVHEIVDLEHLISRADRALYTAKDDGRDCVRTADPDPPAVRVPGRSAHPRDLRADHSGRAPSLDPLEP